MTEFVHTIKDGEPIEQDETAEIEWSLKVEGGGKMCLMGNKKGSSCRYYMVTIRPNGKTGIHSGFGILGLPQPALLGN